MGTKHIYSNPDQYSENNALQFNFATKVLETVKIDNQARVLNLGCGDGKITNELAKIAFKGRVIGTDISHQMIEHAAKTYADQNNLSFTQMNASQNKFIGQFDVITSFNCLHWVKDQQDALDGIAKAAIPGAKVILLLSHKKSIYHHALDSVCNTRKWIGYFKDYVNPRSFYSVDDYIQMLVKSGLEIGSLVEEEMSYSFATQEYLKEFFRSSMANIKQITEERKEDFLVDFCKEFIKQLGLKVSDYIPVTFNCIVVKASKLAYL